jgi:Na+:H+ antiporter, NhaA family
VTSPGTAARAAATLQRFLHTEAASGVVLLFAAAMALAWANSPAAHAYELLWELPLSIDLFDFGGVLTPHFLINDGLMTLFFLVVGMEIRREMHEGALSNPRQAMLPVAAAIGGVLVPALIYTAMNGDPARLRGWAVPTATDIAFAVGVLALLGRGIPGNVRIFLLALAIIDDIVAVLIIALFYSDGLDAMGLLVAGGGLLVILGMQRIGISSAWSYVLPSAVVWFGVLMTGAHPTLSGVVLGLITPVRSTHARERAGIAPPVVRVQMALHPWVTYGVMPLFALANAGVSVAGTDLSLGGAQWVLAGVMLALVLGKPAGVVGVSWLMVRLRLCTLPAGVSWGGIWLIGLLAGIGFTMSIFVAMLAFHEPALLGGAKLGVLLGSATAAVSGLIWGLVYRKRLARTPVVPAI